MLVNVEGGYKRTRRLKFGVDVFNLLNAPEATSITTTRLDCRTIRRAEWTTSTSTRRRREAFARI